jgi:hypothetical protein
MENEKKEAIERTQALIEMYQAGFLDGYVCFKSKRGFWNKEKVWAEIRHKCREQFDFRFMKRLKKNLKNKKIEENSVYDKLQTGSGQGTANS